MKHQASLLISKLPREGRDILGRGLGGYASYILMFVRTLTISVMLPPEQLGATVSVTLIVAYAQFVDLGATSAMEARLPEFDMTDKRTVPALTRGGFEAKFVGAILGSAIIVLSTNLIGPTTAEIRSVVIFAAVIFPFSAVFSAQQAYLRATQQYRGLAFSLILSSGGNLVLGVSGGLTFGLDGVLAGQALATALGVLGASAFGATLPSVHPGDIQTILSLIRFGWPLMVISLAQYNLVYIDQIVVVQYLGQQDLAAYSLVIAFGTILYCIPVAMAGAYAPRMIRAFADHGLGALARQCWRPTELLRIILPLLIGLVWVVVFASLRTFMRKYELVSGPPALVYLISIYFLGTNLVPSSAMIPFRKHASNVPIIISIIVVNYLAGWLAVGFLNEGLTGVAWASVIGYALYMTVNLGYVAYNFERSFARTVRTCWHFNCPGVVLILLGFVTVYAVGAQSQYSLCTISGGGAVLSAVMYLRNRSVKKYCYSDAEALQC